MEELIDVLDENGIFTGEVLSRKEVHKRGLWHRAIVVAIINEEVSVLLGYRTEIKDFRYMYCFRKEEKFKEDFIERQFYDFFILRTKGVDDKTLYFQTDEVQAVKFVDLTEMQKMIDENVIVERLEVYKVLTNFLFRF